MSFVISLVNKYGLIVLFILVGLEYACFPIPSEVVLPFLGFITKSFNYNIVGVISFSVILGYGGSLICYVIGWYGGSYIYKKLYNKYSKIQKALAMADNNFEKHGNMAVFVCRLIPLCRTYISFFAGTFKQSFFVYSFYTVLGITIWNTILITLGYLFADNWSLVVQYYNNYKLLFVFIIVVLLFVVVYKRVKKEKTINGD